VHDDYFAKKRAELGFERVDQLAIVQAWCDERYPGVVRVRQLHQGILRIITTSSGVAGELRMKQMEILAVARTADTDQAVIRVAISISSLS
jgi:hypothetical protein